MIQFLKFIFSNLWTYVLIIFIFIPTILAVDLVQHYRNNQIVEVLEQVEEPEKTIEVVDAVPDQEFQNISLRDESQGIFGSNDFIDGGITGELRFFSSRGSSENNNQTGLRKEKRQHKIKRNVAIVLVL